MTQTENLASLFGRVFLALIFVISGFGKVLDFGGTLNYMETYGIPMAGFLLVCAFLIEIVGGVLLAVGFKARFAAWALIVFTVLATLMFHDFWSYDGAERATQWIQFLKNLSMAGGLLLVVAFGPGAYSLDRGRP